MQERIKKVRKALNLTQLEFGKRIGTTQNAVGNYEIGYRNPSSSVINNICKTFNVNEEWLRTGQGEMFLQTTDSILDALAQKYDLSHDVRVLIEEFINLKPDIQQTFVDYALNVAKALQNKNKKTEKNVSQITVEDAVSKFALPTPDVTQDVMSKLAEMERQNQEMARQNKELLTRLEILEKEEGEWEKEQVEQSIPSTRSHT